MADSNLPYFLLGVGVGAAVGLLYAPNSGEETRRELRSRADEGRDYLRRRGNELRGQAEDLLDRGREGVRTQRDQLASALEAGRRAYRDATTYEDADAPA